MKTIFLYITIFTTGAVILVIEILGTRILAPFYGSTIFVWSSLITVTMAFLALGYFLGGKLADKVTPQCHSEDRDLKVATPSDGVSLLYWIIFIAGVSILLIPKYDKWVLIHTDFLGFKFGPLMAAFILFAAPLFLLGMVAPFAVKIRTQALDHLGMTAGSLYALATVGSLVGAVLAGFFLIPNFSIATIINFSGFLLIIIVLLRVGLRVVKGKLRG